MGQVITAYHDCAEELAITWRKFNRHRVVPECCALLKSLTDKLVVEIDTSYRTDELLKDETASEENLHDDLEQVITGFDTSNVEIDITHSTNKLVKDEPACDRRLHDGVEQVVTVFSNCEVGIDITHSTNELLKAQADVWTKRWSEEYDDIMVETRAFQEAKETLEESHSVLIYGAPGDGKTAIAVHLVRSLVADGYLPVVVCKPSDVQKYCNPTEKMVFLIDDVFGTSYFVNEYLEEWVRRGKIISVLMSENIKLIFTSRNEILHESLTKLHGIPAFENVINLQNSRISLDSREKKAIFNNLISKFRRSNDYSDDAVAMFCCESPIIGFPATCRLLAVRESMNDPQELMNAPFAFLVKEIRRISEIEETKFQYAILVLIMLYNGRLPQRLLSDTSIPKNDKTKIQNVLDALGIERTEVHFRGLAKVASAATSYIHHRNGFWIFIGNAIKDALIVVFCQDHLSICIQYADRRYLYSLLDTDDNCSYNTIAPRVILGQHYFREIVCIMTNDVLKGQYRAVFKAKFLRDQSLQKAWLNYLIGSDNLDNFIRVTDEYDMTPMFYIGKYGLIELLDILNIYILRCPNRFKKVECIAYATDDLLNGMHIFRYGIARRLYTFLHYSEILCECCIIINDRVLLPVCVVLMKFLVIYLFYDANWSTVDICCW